MFVLIVCLMALLYTQHWLFACLLVGWFFFNRRSLSLKSPRDFPIKFEPEDISSSRRGFTAPEFTGEDLRNLSALRLEIERLLADGAVDQTLRDLTTRGIDSLMLQVLLEPDAVQGGGIARERLEAAWELLVRHGMIPPDPPPWRHEERVESLSAPPSPQPSLQRGEGDFRSATEEVLLWDGMASPASGKPEKGVGADSPVEPATAAPQSADLEAPASSLLQYPSSAEENLTAPPLERDGDRPSSYGWKPTPPAALERALRTVSGWPALLAPFLVQNIGWFVGGLCFVAGSVFLVAYTTGLFKALTVAAVLFTYTLLILWAGYQLRRRRADLETSSNVLLSLGMLIIPLNIAAAVRVMAAGEHLAGFLVGIVTAGTVSAGLYFCSALVSGIMDRSLQGRHPRLFFGLAATQLAVPLLSHFPSRSLLACLHLLLLGLLGYGLISFTRDWLHSIFVDQRKIAYYAAGTLVYAAIVSFVHLTWGYSHPMALPGGYYGPFLMALCGLLFTVDAQLKRWTKQYAFLSRITFAIYGLSILALALSADWPTARIITLVLGVGLYGMVVWQYLTLPPLSLLLACVGWLYGLIILRHLPAHWHLLASLPGLIALYAASDWLRHRRSTSLALNCTRIWMGTAVALTAWSLIHAQPGLPAMSTAFALMGLLYAGLRSAPGPLVGGNGKTMLFADLRQEELRDVDLRNGPWLYVVTFMGTVAVVYAPRWPGLVSWAWAAQCAVGLVLLAVLWAWLGFRLSRFVSLGLQTNAAASEVLFNSSLFNLGLCLIPAMVLAHAGAGAHRVLPLVPAAMGSVLLWLSLKLRERCLFYGVLGLWAVAGTIFKITTFPQAGTGAAAMLLAMAVWAFLWWLEREPEEVKALRREQTVLQAANLPPLTLLWRFKILRSQTFEEMLCPPLLQAMGLLWFVGVGHLGARLLTGQIGWGWVFSASLGAGVSLLAGGRFRLPGTLPVSMLLGLAAWLTVVFLWGATSVSAASFAATLFMLLAWRLCTWALAHPASPQLAKTLHVGGDPVRTEREVHYLAFVVTVLAIGLSLLERGLFSPHVVFPLTLTAGAVFLWLAGQRYHQKFHSHTLLGVCVTGGILAYVQGPFFIPSLPQQHPHPASLQELLKDPGLGLWLVILGLIMWTIARWLDRAAGKSGELQSSFDDSLYRKPLRVAAVVLSLYAAGVQILAAWGKPVSTGSLLSISVLVAAGGGLLLANHALRRFALDLAGILFVALAALWTEIALFHTGAVLTILPGDGGFSDLPLTMSLLGFGLAFLAEALSRHEIPEEAYSLPLRTASRLASGWALLWALTLFIVEPFKADAFLPWTFLTLSLCLFPLPRSLRGAATIRGTGIPLLWSALIVSALALMGLSRWMSLAALLWGYTLWSMGNFVLPSFNTRHPSWAVAPDPWIWLGLPAVSYSLLVSAILPWDTRPCALFCIGTAGACAVYLLLMQRNSSWAGFPWLASLLLTYTGLSLNGLWMGIWRPLAFYEPLVLSFALPFASLVHNLIWINLLMEVVPLWRRHGEELRMRLGWWSNDLAAPFLIWPTAILFLWLVQLLVFQALSMEIVPFAFRDLFPAQSSSSTILPGSLLTLSFLHLWWIHRGSGESHAILCSLFCTLLAGWSAVAPGFSHLPLFLALWSAAMLLTHSLWELKPWGGEATRPVRHALSAWLVPSLIAAGAALFLTPQVSLLERLSALAVLTAVAANLGWQRRQHYWLSLAMVMFVVLLHGWPLLYVPFSHVTLLLPWYALQSILLVWLLLWANDRLQRYLEKPEEADGHEVGGMGRIDEIVRLFSGAWPAILMLAVGEWAAHGTLLVVTLAAQAHPQWLAGRADAVAAIVTALLILLAGVRQIRRLEQKSSRAVGIWAATAFGGATGLYIRVLLVGLAPVSVWDTAALMGATYILFIIQHLAGCSPLRQVVLVMPALALLTVPFQLASAHAGVTLVSAGAFYLLTYREGRKPLPLYLALLAFNGALYLWVPVWAESSRLFQVFITPAAITVLLFLHLHRKELKPSVLNSARLAATSILYAAATLDVFLRGDLPVFAVMLALSLTGIFVGIALRIRAFLYSGVAFLVLNVLGQLLLLFPEARLGKAILLLILGGAITGGMIWFNMKREAILQRIRIFRADLETWS